MATSPSVIDADVPPQADDLANACRAAVLASLDRAEAHADPFPHRLLADVLPPAVIQGLADMPIEASPLEGRSGARELHNDTRHYLDARLIAVSPLCAAVAQAFQSAAVVARMEATLGATLNGCCLRLEYAQDTDGFWLQPHTDLGVKRVTLLCYLGPDDRPDLGTDLYREDQTWSRRPNFAPGGAVAFVPSDRSWHGFEARPIGDVRKSLIVNYVTSEWRAREQLAFPYAPVVGRSAS